MSDRRGGTTPAGAWLSGLVLGTLAGLTSISFVLGLLGLPIIVVSILLIAWKGPRLIAGAGFLTGWGLLWSVAITQSTVACLTFERGPGRWCEPGDVGPWLVAGIVMFVIGLLGSAAALRRHLQQR
jgi:hypothetical protein